MAACRGGDLRRDPLGRPRQRSAGGDAGPRVFANVMNGRGRAPLFEVTIVHLELRCTVQQPVRAARTLAQWIECSAP